MDVMVDWSLFGVGFEFWCFGVREYMWLGCDVILRIIGIVGNRYSSLL